MDLLLSGRVIDADEAQRLGLVNFVSEPGQVLEDAVAYASDVAANCSPRSLETIKAQVHQDLERTLDEGRLAALQLLARFRDTPDFREGVNSYIEKRPPAFPGISRVLTDERNYLP